MIKEGVVEWGRRWVVGEGVMVGERKGGVREGEGEGVCPRRVCEGRRGKGRVEGSVTTAFLGRCVSYQGPSPLLIHPK